MNSLPLASAPLAEPNIVAFMPRRCPTTDIRHSELASGDMDQLNRLRWLALKSRLAPKPDIERACFLLAGKPTQAVEPVANAFFRGLEQHALRPVEFYRPGTPHPSNDEIWLLRLLSTFRAGQEKEAAALVQWRVQPRGRRWMRFLAASLAEHVAPDPGGRDQRP